MSQLVHEKIATGEARIVAAPKAKVRHQIEDDRNFELPTGLYATTVACYLAFLGIMLAAFAAPMLAIPAFAELGLTPVDALFEGMSAITTTTPDAAARVTQRSRC